MKKKILFFTGSRADYGILKPLIQNVKNKNYANVKLAASAQHFSKTFGYTYKQIKRDGFNIDFKSKIKFEATDMAKIIYYLSDSLKEYYKIIEKTKPSLVVILGDRYEVFCFTLIAYLSGIPVAHLHGGELTYGSFDDGLRHAISKLSDYHFVSHETYKKRVIQLGENPKRVFNVGALAMDNIYNSELYNKNFLFKKFNISTTKKIALVTFHPVTKNNTNYEDQITTFLNALKKVDEYYYVFTYNNSDPRGKNFIKSINNFAKNNNNCKIFKTMGTKIYLSFIKNASVVVGNSSSGIYEAPALKTITLNIGNRQDGRILGNSIINSKINTKEIISKLRKIYKKQFKVNYKNIYFKKNIAENISSKIKKILNGDIKTTKNMKRFYDIKF